MSDHVTDVMIAGYMTKEPALLDYEAVLKSGAKIEGVVVVSRDLEGNTSIEETDHLKRSGATGWARRALSWGCSRRRCSSPRSLAPPSAPAVGHLARQQGQEPDRRAGGGNDPVGWGRADRRLPA